MSSSSSRTVSSPSEVTTGLALMFLSVMVSPLIDIFSKLAVVTIPSAEVTAARFAIQALCMLPIVLWRRSFTDFSWSQSLFHAIRGAIITVSMISFVTTLKYMAVADAIAIFFVEPIIVTIFGGIFLKETIGWRRYTACGVGFFGAMLIIQPSFEEVGYVALLPVLSALCIAIFVLMTRVLSHREDPWAMQFQMGIWGLLFCAILLYFGEGTGSDLLDPVMPQGNVWFYLAGVGATAAIAGIFGVYAYRAAPASTLAPLQYFEIVSATIFAWLVFGDFPNAVKWLGIMIIMASGFYILWRERRFASRPVSDTSEATLAP
ncbi:drug/metabolite transporter (DMT)-like permease [Rhizobium leguminosarum]|uniref:Drug/metabolite transporter (DMT)-like permease n=1 Tax=Rhizobium leguminosarum TaxID=384 RepID=A0AAE2MKT8_RHILE|nr:MULTISPECIES: DMT family transporter [Rhizobium]MBB4291331.1 drug/metabolite transporter (DMT)-like permease [Rhizobium leguminosarum]MBB4297574.1 drug/metabolite transporter (DMT)-like permease [Rhizobium leguminosarum]MBB4308714.1 drug/metabolite transporter (DMT)-like permease [Rhizobium leguminosarum]MBB4416549.1 drug/metabolite transporter (DMT)-like permease [Rhizobium leguminosarum]MBB4430483.1 drug/metabolite transporter (DMT)-like permease [Rhizobium esperanzae]